MRSSNCKQDCEYFKWCEHGANYKAYCAKANALVIDISQCPNTSTITTESGV
jgi:sulfatase maturation enzyme AslB (radical SAM superfamily)